MTFPSIGHEDSTNKWWWNLPDRYNRKCNSLLRGGNRPGDSKMKVTQTQRAAIAALLCLPLAAQSYAPAENARIPSGGIHFSSEDQFHGSVAGGTATAAALQLSLQDAIDRGIRSNLGLLVRGSETSAARADRLRALSALLPNVSASATEIETQLNLAVYGFHFSGVPSIVGPFSYTDVHASLAASFSWTALRNLRSAAESAHAAALSVEDGRDLVVQAVAAGYFAVLAASGSVEAIRTQVETAEALYNVARDRHQAGVSAAIDELRAQVEWKTQQQRLLAQQNQLARGKLALARVIGLPSGQVFDLTSQAPYTPLESLRSEDLLRQAYGARADYRSGEAQLRAAEVARQAAGGERYPVFSASGTYGDIGPTLAQSHGVFTLTGTASLNIFDGGRVRADESAADSEVSRRRDELADLRGKIDFDVRTALLDLSTAADQVALARSNLDLANRTLQQARDRFASGVADTIEVVQAQEAVAGANQDLVNSLYAHNLAKVSLARAVGGTETALMQFLGGK
jgi:outer membrane protein TolC